MTEQIVIKLNKKKFQPLLDNISEWAKNTFSSYSECVSKSVVFMYLYCNEKLPSLENKTRFEYILEKRSISNDESIVTFLARYNELIKKDWLGTSGN